MGGRGREGERALQHRTTAVVTGTHTTVTSTSTTTHPAPTTTDRGSPLDPLPVVVRCVGPPICLGLHVAKDHVLHWNRQPRHLHAAKQPAVRVRTAQYLQCFSLLSTHCEYFYFFYGYVFTRVLLLVYMCSARHCLH